MCPHCKNAVLTARIEAIPLYELNGGELKGVKYVCLSCGYILGVGIDPLAQVNSIVNDVVVKLQKVFSNR
jgi:hypothetical protein